MIRRMINSINRDEIIKHLKTEIIAKEILLKDVVESTNDDAKAAANEQEPEGTVFAAREQTSGKGRGIKRFDSPKGGIYLSVILDGRSLNADMITIAAGVAVHKAVYAATELDCGIKWVNDIYFSEKKICGILCESVRDAQGKLKYACGIGINCFRNESNDLDENYGFIAEFSKREININQLFAQVLNELESALYRMDRNEIINYHKAHSMLLGRLIGFVTDNRAMRGVVVSIDSDGALVVRSQGQTMRLTSGEISIIKQPQTR